MASQIFSTQDRERVAALQWYAKHVVDGLTVGMHRSPLKGASVEFKEHRQYVRGDEIRSIDWKLYGKTDRLYIRQYEDETNLRATLIVDQSGSMKYSGAGEKGAVNTSKHEFALRLAACLAHLWIGQQDAVGLATFDTTVRSYIPPRARPNHLHAILSNLGNSNCGGETSLAEVLKLMAPKVRRRGQVVLISDAFDNVESLLRSLALLRHQNNEVVLFHVLHPDERTFPFRGRTQFRSLENQGIERLLDPVQVRKNYLKNFEAFLAQLTEGCMKQRIDLVTCSTDRSHSEILSEYIAKRERSR